MRAFPFLMAVLAGAWAGTGAAETVRHLEATHTGDRYTVSFEVLLEAPRDKVWDIMTDYEHLPEISTLIVQSRVLAFQDANQQRLDLSFRGCVLFFCKTARRVTDVRLWPPREVLSLGDPTRSDFRYSRERWRLAAEDSRTLLHYEAELEPNFFIPPLIGPPVMKYFLEREIRTTAQRVESRAKHE